MARLKSNLSKMAAEAPAVAGEALHQTAADIVSVVKQLSPVDTGALRQSYGAVPVDSDTILIGTDRLYGPFVEYGTVKMSAQPHLRPAMMQAEMTFRARLLQAMAKRWK